ncbi:exodeoxyribonuclease III [Candidatus Woesearchaeota archaeon]|jgi:exodeoxyribonuclease-3|nr:exodeoxyribonuclease III [Candidatus Woesearchaeota archaeon]MBT4150423.1 exodeoxyribonuclease III [Candidatus Woesearchaeota archaeon]MBT4247502.1 exodeoxyribonuclease III [Candidatus Woesearchaeota archaeon]MBT4434459.1 exodeoxyribonuclease III [Candidatus Woesearchaeota archaeon]MBT7331687.1 exodeoxyribonuclease III [Candidatus Woesearchaeota archaeon]
MKIISWNVNGIRACVKKGFLDFIEKEKPDVICLQETKAHPDQVDDMLAEYEHHYWNSAEKKGYAGTAIFSKVKPISVLYGDEPMDDDQGRVIAVEFEDYYLVTVYTPNSKRGLVGLDRRAKWDKDFHKFIMSLEKKKPVIFCGDLNVAHTDIDLKNFKANYNKNAGYTQKEIDGLERYIDSGYIDSFREFEKEGGHYTWWSYMFNARANNTGWRIDYFMVSKKLKNQLKDAFILKDVMGSDHCPVGILLK